LLISLSTPQRMSVSIVNLSPDIIEESSSFHSLDEKTVVAYDYNYLKIIIFISKQWLQYSCTMLIDAIELWLTVEQNSYFSREHIKVHRSQRHAWTNLSMVAKWFFKEMLFFMRELSLFSIRTNHAHCSSSNAIFLSTLTTSFNKLVLPGCGWSELLLSFEIY
jgi:hypothetical protein